MTRARRLQCEQHELAIERAGFFARRYFYLSRSRDQSINRIAYYRIWMWFYLLEQAYLMQEGA